MYAVLRNRPVTEDVLSTTLCNVEQTLNARLLTPFSSDVNDLEALTPITSCLATGKFAYPTYHAQKNLLIIESSFETLKPLKILIWDRFCKEYLPTLNNRQKWRSTANETLKEGDLVWLIEDSDKRGYYNLGRVTETIGRSEGGGGGDSISDSSNERRSVQETSSEARPSTTWERCFRDRKQGRRCGG